MRYLHSMVRVHDLEQSLDFYCRKFGMREVDRVTDENGRYTLVFLAAPGDSPEVTQNVGKEAAPPLELTYNWDTERYAGGRNFGHLAFEVEDIYKTCSRLSRSRALSSIGPARREDGVHSFSG